MPVPTLASFYSAVFLLLLPHLCTCLTDQCDLEMIRIPGDIVVSTIAGLREPRDGVCGRFIPGELQAAAAMAWAVEKLNGSSSGQSYLPGKTIGIDIADDCSLERKAVKIAIDTQIRIGFPDTGTCSRAPSTMDNSTIVGIIDTSTSQTVQQVASLIQDSHLPVIGTSSTAAALGNNTLYPSFYRTVPSDVEQTKVLLETVKALNWTYIAVVYTSDAYGMDGVRLLRKLIASEERVCIIVEQSISPHETKPEVAKDILSELASKLTRTRHLQLGIVYIGQLPQAILLIHTQQGGAKVYKDFERLFWVMSEAIGTNKEMIPSVGNQLGGLITVALPSIKIAEFKRYFLEHLENVIQGTSNHPLTGLFKKYIEIVHKCNLDKPRPGTCSGLDRAYLEAHYQQSDYVVSAIDAVYVLLTAVKNDPSPCPGDSDCVPPLYKYRNLASRVGEVVLEYSKMDDRTAPYVFSLLNRVIRFDKAGEVITNDKTVSYEIYNVWGQKHVKVGSYTNKTLTLNKADIQVMDPDTGLSLRGSNLPRSTCQASCPDCQPTEDIQFSYIPGDMLIVGLFSLSDKSNGDFRCGKFRSNTVSYLTFEAFEYAINVIQKEHPTLKFGGLAFDDCYNPLRAEYILSNFLSGKYTLLDHGTGKIIDPKKVALVVGPLSSDVTLEVADMLTRLKIPQISYGATSVDLDNREKYPYFLRTVPSDETQVMAIVDILDRMNWKYVAVMYMDNNYGTRGMKAFKELANKRGICLADSVIPISKSIIDEKFKDIVSSLRRTYAKVIIYFGIDTLAEKLLDGLRTHSVHAGEFLFVGTEAWGINEQLLKNNRESYAKGAIVLHSDTTLQAKTQQFREFFTKKDPFTCSKCAWFRSYWQDRFQCNFEDGYTGPAKDLPLCNRRDHGRLNSSEINKYSHDQRVVQTINAVYAGAEGIKMALDALCHGQSCRPTSLRTNLWVNKLTKDIRHVTLPSSMEVRLFDENGNGKIGFSIFNIQYSIAKARYEYVDVGKYEGRNLILDKDKLVFYDKYGHQQPASFITSACVLDSQCLRCENQTRASAPSNANTSSSISTLQTSDPSMEGIVIGLSVLAGLSILALIMLVLVYCVCLRRKTSPDKSHGESNVYHEVGGRINNGFSVSESASPDQNGSGSTNSHLPIPESPLYHEVNNQDRGNIPAWMERSEISNCNNPSAFNPTGASVRTFRGLVQSCTCATPIVSRVRTEGGYILICQNCGGIATIEPFQRISDTVV